MFLILSYTVTKLFIKISNVTFSRNMIKNEPQNARFCFLEYIFRKSKPLTPTPPPPNNLCLYDPFRNFWTRPFDDGLFIDRNGMLRGLWMFSPIKHSVLIFYRIGFHSYEYLNVLKILYVMLRNKWWLIYPSQHVFVFVFFLQYNFQEKMP